MTTSRTKQAIYDAAFKNAPASIGMEILFDHYGFHLFDIFGDVPEDLASDAPDLDSISTLFSEEILRLANEQNLAPFDGILADLIEDGDTEQDCITREDILHFVRNWHQNVRGML